MSTLTPSLKDASSSSMTSLLSSQHTCPQSKARDNSTNSYFMVPFNNLKVGRRGVTRSVLYWWLDNSTNQINTQQVARGLVEGVVSAPPI